MLLYSSCGSEISPESSCHLRRCFRRRQRGSVLEIRTYRLKPGTTAAFHDSVAERSVPLLCRFDIDVVRFRPSEQNEHGVEEYVLMRSFESMAARDEQEDRFYGSQEMA